MCHNQNIGSLDRILRITVGVILISLTALQLIGLWGWIGIVPLATGLLRNCPLYTVLGLSSKKSCNK
jgi:hypothetical protein